MSIFGATLGEKTTGVTMYVQPAPKVVFADDCQPFDPGAEHRNGIPVLIDWDEFEQMILDGKFKTKSAAVDYCRALYADIYDEDDEETHWNKESWRRIRKGLFPEVLAAFEALPHSDVMERVDRMAMVNSKENRPGGLLLAAGQCKHGHKIKGPKDLASIGADSKGRPRLGCIHCRRKRSREARERNATKENS